MENKKIRVTIWNEYRHERTDEAVRALYPNGIHAFVGEFLKECDDIEVTLAALDDPEQGLPDEVLNNTDVLMWWGHIAHHEVSDELVARIRNRVYNEGMGFIAMHSAHASKTFGAIVGTSGNLTWGEECKEIVWNLNPAHPIAAGVPEHFVLDCEEMYGEQFAIPTPDDLVFGMWYETGNIFRGGCTWQRGFGKVFYFQPGHESRPAFYNPHVQRILKNAVHWAAPADLGYEAPKGCVYQPERL